MLTIIFTAIIAIVALRDSAIRPTFVDFAFVLRFGVISHLFGVVGCIAMAMATSLPRSWPFGR